VTAEECHVPVEDPEGVVVRVEDPLRQLGFVARFSEL